MKNLKQLTVLELIELLKTLPPDAFVFTEDCCAASYGYATDVEQKDDYVIIKRAN